jgi:hypothetical protein
MSLGLAGMSIAGGRLVGSPAFSGVIGADATALEDGFKAILRKHKAQGLASLEGALRASFDASVSASAFVELCSNEGG